MPATVSFDIQWSNVLEEAKVTNDTEAFTGQFGKTGATISWSSNEAGFSFVSEAPDPARNYVYVVAAVNLFSEPIVQVG